MELSSSFAVEQPSAGTLTAAIPILTLPSTLYPTSAQATVTLLTIITSIPTTDPTLVRSLASTRSSTCTTIRLIPEATPAPTTRPALQNLVDTGVITNQVVTPPSETLFEIQRLLDLTDTPAYNETWEWEFNSQLIFESVPSPIHQLAYSGQFVPPHLPRNESEEEQGLQDDFDYFDFSAYAEVTHEAESSNSTGLNSTSSLKRPWDPDDYPELDADYHHFWKRHRGADTDSIGVDYGNLENSRGHALEESGAESIRIEHRRSRQRNDRPFLGLESALLALLCLLTLEEKPDRKRRRPPNSSSGSEENTRIPPSHNDEEYDIVSQPVTVPLSQEQLIAEFKGIYAGLVMVEAKCVEVDAKQGWVSSGGAEPKLSNEQWQALIALHRTLLHEHHDFFLASQHPSASPALRRLATKYAMPTRMWRHGIHSFLELLRHRLPHSCDHMLAFIYLAYTMMTLDHDTVPDFEDTWIEYLGDLGSYQMAIEDDDIRDRQVWTEVARHWYSKASDKELSKSRLYHHLAILARPNFPFASTRESILRLFEPVISAESNRGEYRLPPLDTNSFKAHGLLFRDRDIAKFEPAVDEFIGLLDNQIGRVTRKFMEQGYHQIAVANSVAQLGFAFLDRTIWWNQLQHIDQDDHIAAQPSSYELRTSSDDCPRRRLVRMEDLFSLDWSSDFSVDEEERCVEVPSMSDERRERILWLASRLTQLQDTTAYSSRDRTLSYATGDSNNLSSPPEVYLDGDIQDLAEDESDLLAKLDREANIMIEQNSDWEFGPTRTSNGADCDFETLGWNTSVQETIDPSIIALPGPDILQSSGQESEPVAIDMSAPGSLVQEPITGRLCFEKEAAEFDSHTAPEMYSSSSPDETDKWNISLEEFPLAQCSQLWESFEIYSSDSDQFASDSSSANWSVEYLPAETPPALSSSAFPVLSVSPKPLDDNVRFNCSYCMKSFAQRSLLT